LILAGPTGSGKTDLALVLARRHSAEIISADSRQVYQGLRAGTAKPEGAWVPTPQGQRYAVQGVLHHLLDHVPPTDPYTAGDFVRESSAVLEDLQERGVPAIIVGGTGMYLRSLVRGLAPLPTGDLRLRAELAARAEREGRAALHGELSRVDPAAALNIPANNLQRVVRALEVYRLTGRRLSDLQREGTRAAPWDFVWCGLRWDSAAALGRLEQRCRSMAEGILTETKDLLARGVPPEAPAFQSLGYREALAHQAARISREEFDREFFKQTRLYAKRQWTWFRGEKELRWLEVRSPFHPEEAADGVQGYWV
jgi:tRNA dimethylallyltransferase